MENISTSYITASPMAVRVLGREERDELVQLIAEAVYQKIKGAS